MVTITKDGPSSAATTSCPASSLETASTAHSNNEHQSSPLPLFMTMASSQSQPIQTQPLFSTQPSTQLDHSPSGNTISTTSQLHPHALIADSQNHHPTFPESQLTLLSLQTQPETQHEYQLPLAKVPQHYENGSHCNRQRIIEEAATDQAFITQPMTQQYSNPSPCCKGSSSASRPENEHDCTDYDVRDEATEQECVEDDGIDDAMDVGSSLSTQSVAMKHVTTNDASDNENEVRIVGDGRHSESIDHHQANTGSEVLAPPPLPLSPQPLQSLTSTGNILDKEQLYQSSQSIQKMNPVVNPYAKKRPLDQCSRSSSSSSGSIMGGATISIASSRNVQNKDFIHANNAAADAGSTVSRKPVYNPYSKTKTNALQRHAISTSVSAMKAAASPIFTTNNFPANNHTKTTVGNTAREDGVPSRMIMKQSSGPIPAPTSRRSSISISLPIYERLPSRNVSYQPAEILTVGELYRYLYRPRLVDEIHHYENESHQPSSRKSAAAGCLEDVELGNTVPHEISSIRITGTLLCVATSNPDERDASKDSLYSRGSYLLIGDPLETSRLSKKEVIHSVKSDTKNANTPEGGSATILKSNNTSCAESSTVTADTPSATSAATSNSVTDQTGGAQRANEKDTSLITVKRRELNRGILNTQKKKLVYNGGGKRLSFGGKGLGGNAKGGGVHGGSLLMGGRKFVTPKRYDSIPNVTQRLSFGPAMKRVSYISGSAVAGQNATNPKPEFVIQEHPSPIVPVWLGSFYDDDGLDGSVVGDLVMIMGELVTECCVNCQINSAHLSDESENEGGNEGISINDTVNRTADVEEEFRSSSHMRTYATQIRGVKDASSSIASIAVKATSERQPSIPTMTPKCNSYCTECLRFVRARFVKNANGTDMLLQREALRARRAYLQGRKRQIESLIPGCKVSKGLYSVGCGPPNHS